MRMSEKCHNNSDNPSTSRHTDGGENLSTQLCLGLDFKSLETILAGMFFNVSSF